VQEKISHSIAFWTLESAREDLATWHSGCFETAKANLTKVAFGMFESAREDHAT
jgi:hypothetical protein